MGSEVVGAAPRRLIRVAICPSEECEWHGVPVPVPNEQLTYLCSCGETIDTQPFNLDAHERSLQGLEEDRDAAIDSTVRWCYAPQLNLDKDGGEPYG